MIPTKMRPTDRPRKHAQSIFRSLVLLGMLMPLQAFAAPRQAAQHRDALADLLMSVQPVEVAPPPVEEPPVTEEAAPADTGEAVQVSDEMAGQAELPVPDVPSEEFDGEEFAMEPSSRFSLNYFGILYGPSLKNPSAYQPTPEGAADTSKPILTKSYLALGYHPNENLIIAPTAYWSWQPVMGQELQMNDPFLRIGYDGVVRSEVMNLYSDVRFHFPVTYWSQQADMLAGVQTFHILTYVVGESDLSVGLYGSARFNFFGRKGYGNDLELYLGPNLRYEISRKLAFTLLYEMGASHVYGEKAFDFHNDGTDLEPGLSWDVTPNLNLNPYVNLYPGGKVNLKSSSFGMLMSWKLL